MLFDIFIHVHIYIYKSIYVSVFALADRLDVAIAFLHALLAMKRGGCQRCGSVLRGRGVGYCWWCKKYNAIGVVTETPGSLWLMSQGALDVPCVDWRIAMHCGSSVAVGLVGDSAATMLSESGGDGLCVSDSLADMHVSPMSSDSDVEVLDVLDNFDMCVSPISSDSDVLTLEVLRHSSGSYEELARSRVVCALAVLLQSDSLASIFSYCNDYCRFLTKLSRLLSKSDCFQPVSFDALCNPQFRCRGVSIISFACVMTDSRPLKNAQTAAEGLQSSIFVASLCCNCVC